jgi:hypothetical protein
MTKILVDETLRTKLQNLTQPLELCDEAGHVLGRFEPVLDPALYDLEPPPMTEEDLERIRQQKFGKTYTTAEVIAYLEKL